MRPILFLSLVFLVRLAFTDYYIDFEEGNDTNPGTKSRPWQRHPYMKGWEGKEYSHAPGSRFIFRGGVTWNSTCFPMAINNGGIKGKMDFYCADAEWKKKEPFTKPVFDGEYRCNSLIHFTQTSGFTNIENLELKRIRISSDTLGWLVYSSVGVSDLRIARCLLHDWRIDHERTTDGQRGGIHFSDAGGLPDNLCVEHCRIHNMDGGYMDAGNKNVLVPHSGGVALRSVQKAVFDTIHHVSSVFLHGGELVHDCYVHDVVPSYHKEYHTNGFYLDQWMTPPCTRPSFFFNNKIINARIGGSPIFPILWGSPPGTGQSVRFYIFNNLIMGGNPPYGITIGSAPNMEDLGSGGIAAYYYLFNNTIEIPNNTGCGRTARRTGEQIPKVIKSLNNFGIFDGANPWMYSASDSVVESNNLCLTHAEAEKMGYTAPNSYRPATAQAQTVRAGIDLSDLFDIPYPIDTDIDGGKRIEKKWDIGAYQYQPESDREDSSGMNSNLHIGIR